MRRSIKLGGVAGIAAALAFGMYISTSSATNTPNTPKPQAVAPPAGAATPLPASTSFVPITPCRIVDTRIHGGAFATNTARAFYVYGSGGIAGQGGKSTGCEIPTSATGLSVALTSTSTAADGFLTAYPTGTGRPSASQLSTLKGHSMTAGADVALGNGTGAVLTIFAHQSTQVIIDVAGYFTQQLAVQVGSDGTIYNSTNHVVSVTHLGTGSYRVTFDRSVAGCTTSSTAQGGTGYSTSSYASGTSGYVTTWTYPGGSPTLTNMYWELVVTC